MGEEEDSANLSSFLEWAAELGISDFPTSSAIPSQDSMLRARGSCLGHSLIVSHFPDAGGYSTSLLSLFLWAQSPNMCACNERIKVFVCLFL